MSQTDAFTDRIFSGNPAVVCVMDKWLSDDLKQSIASEIRLRRKV
jgi:predicted PhzF superfamily epimerase YddE/YHI9